MTVHNRRQHTLDCLASLFANEGMEHVDLSVVMVDDGSTDGTKAAVSAEYPLVKIIHGDGSLFWNKGMHKAFSSALAMGSDYYLWLNDDTLLEHDALSRLLAVSEEIRFDGGKEAIVVGSTIDPTTGQLTYGAQSRTGNPFKPLFLPIVQPTTRRQLCDTMNGNIVLIPDFVARAVGNLDPIFEHAMGDTDYGFRVRKAGFGLWLAPGYFGRCPDNPVRGTFGDKRLPLRERWRKIMGPKGLPWRSWLAITRRYAGVGWPIHFIWPYLKLVIGVSPKARAIVTEQSTER